MTVASQITIMIAFCVAVGAYTLFQLARALRGGVISSPIGPISRTVEPAGYWMMVVAGVAIVAVVAWMAINATHWKAGFL